MKHTFVLILILLSCNSKKKESKILRISEEELIKKNDITYFNEKPFNGISYKMWNNRKLLSERNFKNGKPHGLSRGWFDNGQIMYEGNNINGKEHGTWSHWYISGKSNMVANFKNGILDGSLKRWYENGYLAYERIYLNGEIIDEKVPSHSKKTE